ncbi:MAG: DUF434 domain-containing protein [Pirellulaceae bacterium]
MPDKRQHRGPHPADSELFARKYWPSLQQATADLSWLLSGEYSLAAALKLVGDRYKLRQRQRLAVQRSACSDRSLARRTAHQLQPGDARDHSVDIDGFNLLMTIEAALAGGVIIAGKDGCLRDMASVHGTFRVVEETAPALSLIEDKLCEIGPAAVTWYFDSPVSNSGRIAACIRQIGEQGQHAWTVELVRDPDAILRKSPNVVVTTDSVILDECERWTNLAAVIIHQQVENYICVPMTAS